MNRRGEHKLMEQSNLEDFQNVLQSIKGWGLYWDNYSRTQFVLVARPNGTTTSTMQNIFTKREANIPK